MSEPQSLEESKDNDRTEFDTLANEKDPGIVAEFWYFLRYNKKWWLTPIFLMLVLLGALVLLSASPAAPFIYTLW